MAQSSFFSSFTNNVLNPSLQFCARCVTSKQQTRKANHSVFSCGAAAQRGPWSPHSWGFLIAHYDASQSVRLLWTSDQLVAETSTWQHTIATDNHSCPRWDSNPRSQQVSGRRPTPQTARKLGPAFSIYCRFKFSAHLCFLFCDDWEITKARVAWTKFLIPVFLTRVKVCWAVLGLHWLPPIHRPISVRVPTKSISVHATAGWGTACLISAALELHC